MKKVINIILLITIVIIPLQLKAQSTTIFTEAFENGGNAPTGWVITNYDPINWFFSTNSARYAATITTGSGDYAAVADSDLDGGTMDAFLVTPSVNCALYTNIILTFHHGYNQANESGSEGIYVYISTDGTVDTNDIQILYEGASDILPVITNINITSYASGKSDVKIGFRYKASFDWYWLVDDVTVKGDLKSGTAEPSITFTTTDDIITFTNATITWTDSDTDSDATIELYYDTDTNGYNGTLIKLGISEDSTSDLYTWNVSSLPLGVYSIYAKIKDNYTTKSNYCKARVIKPQTKSLPLIDDFETTTLASSNWLTSELVSFGYTVDDKAKRETSEPYSLHFAKNKDQVTSRVFDTRGLTNIKLSFDYERGGSGDTPETADYLRLYYYNNVNQWKELFKSNGTELMNLGVFYLKEITIKDDDAFHNKFALRFMLDATTTSLDSDNMHIDNLRVIAITNVTTQTQATTNEFVSEQDGETDIIIGRNKIYTSLSEQVLFHTTIEADSADISIYTIDGREVKTFVISPGETKSWPEAGEVPAPGLYIAKIKFGDRSDPVIRRVLVLR